MTTKEQILANRQNALKSTGPRTDAGKQQSAKNSLRHGLNASAGTLFTSNPAEQAQYKALREQLFQQIVPNGPAEELIFEQYAYSTFQALRAQRLEVDAQDRWLLSPENQILFLQMERIVKLGALYERRAAKAFKQLSQLQLDRFAAVEMHAELKDVELDENISPALPCAKLRKHELVQEDALFLGLTVHHDLKLQNEITNPTHPAPELYAA
ncbi:MAG: hypothetical protein FJW36_16430 [Acidobacteria bacterium]|nr:hypothetical protein [Acidobacteriota bacterium]